MHGKRAFWEVRKTVGRIRVHHRPFADLLHNQNLFCLFILVLCESHTLSSLTSSSGPYLYQLRQEFMQYYTYIYIMPHKDTRSCIALAGAIQLPDILSTCTCTGQEKTHVLSSLHRLIAHFAFITLPKKHDKYTLVGHVWFYVDSNYLLIIISFNPSRYI
jgi:hypothetical protein